MVLNGCMVNISMVKMLAQWISIAYHNVPFGYVNIDTFNGLMSINGLWMNNNIPQLLGHWYPLNIYMCVFPENINGYQCVYNGHIVQF